MAVLGVLVALFVAAPGFAAGPKPDPPPIKHAPPPPPAPRPTPPPPAPQPQPAAPPPPVAPAAPAVTHPTTAELRARVAKQAARRKAARAKRLAAQRAKRLAAQRAERRAAQTTEQVRPQPPALTAGASGAASSEVALPILALAFLSAVVMLGLALTPTRAVPWSRASHALEDHRDELGVIGFFALVATMVFFVLVQVTK